ncbi:ORF-70 [Catopsilia pomona nucleopolyhedrovirus]|uniref:ORF-70 n=1 Tax=Catopsilia pomona nucleopolyhedrovirus TaxID=1850906 RepID=A0A172WZD8_9ABAC|nr:ORF-70 [Catopsilia pomona nucleopolyhedrovirus]ANF29718.1 ORF-70 [Catopsilia pomona nucleopolyhedrovirus]
MKKNLLTYCKLKFVKGVSKKFVNLLFRCVMSQLGDHRNENNEHDNNKDTESNRNYQYSNNCNYIYYVNIVYVNN